MGTRRVAEGEKSRRAAERFVSLLVFLSGCHHDAVSSDAGLGVPPSAAPASPSAPRDGGPRSPPPASSARGTVLPHAAACKAATVEGIVTATPLGGLGHPVFALDGGNASVQAAAAVPDDAWIDVGQGSRLTTRDAASTRETTYLGPGRFRVCIGHKEESWVASGVFESIGGAGERPGGEEWVTTPLGVARYGVARLRLTVKDKAVEVRVASGTGYVWPAEGVTAQSFSDAGGPPPPLHDASGHGDGWVRLDGATGVTLTVRPSALTPEPARAAFDTCGRLAAQTKSLTASLGEPDASLTDLAPKHVVARREARAACGVAALRAQLLVPSASRDTLLERLRTAESDYTSIEALAP